MTNYKQLLKNINTFIFDYDGVLTDGTIFLFGEKEPLRTANIKDGYALQLAVKSGYRVAVVSGGRSEFLIHRMEKLGVKDVYLGVNDKLEVFHKFLKIYDIKKEHVLYMGDDIPDYKVMKEAGVATCPANAAEEIKMISNYISDIPGGKGCVRDIIEQVMKVQGRWFNPNV